jgi:hypothetical protein
MVVKVVGAFFIFAVAFSICWFIAHNTFSLWLKYRVLRLGLPPATNRSFMLRSILISHIGYSILFMNPFVVFVVVNFLNTRTTRNGSLLLGLSVVTLCLWALSLGMDCLLQRLLSKWQRLAWLDYHPSLVRLAIVNLGVLLLSLVVASTVGVIAARISG